MFDQCPKAIKKLNDINFGGQNREFFANLQLFFRNLADPENIPMDNSNQSLTTLTVLKPKARKIIPQSQKIIITMNISSERCLSQNVLRQLWKVVSTSLMKTFCQKPDLFVAQVRKMLK